jgi:phosphatidylserine/phosphatidylglycerophosphate/cardiolipin synthase-like enzyme
MIPPFFTDHKKPRLELSTTTLFNQNTFYPAFQKTLHSCRQELIIESPFITMKRINSLLSEFTRLRQQSVNIIVNTRPPEEHDEYLRSQAEEAVELLLSMDVQILYTGGHHRKLAIIDRKILWEGSLNILSQNDSCEIMRRTESDKLASEMINFTGIRTFINSKL